MRKETRESETVGEEREMSETEREKRDERGEGETVRRGVGETE